MIEFSLDGVKIYMVSQGIPPCIGFITTYIVVDISTGSGIIIDPGPRSRIENLFDCIRKLREMNVLKRVEGVFLTHIHLDHAGAASRVVEKLKCCVYIHPRGAKHLIEPEKLWKATLEVLGIEALELGKPESIQDRDLVIETRDDWIIKFNSLEVRTIHTPGHAPHHQAFILNNNVLFSGDACGGYLNSIDVVFPTSPPGLRLELYIKSIEKLLNNYEFHIFAPTHSSISWNAKQVIRKHLEQIKLWRRIIEHRLSIDVETLARFDENVRKLIAFTPCERYLKSIERSLEAIKLELTKSSY